jgi:hypothetical protein
MSERHVIYQIVETDKIGCTKDFERRKKQHRRTKQFGENPEFHI